MANTTEVRGYHRGRYYVRSHVRHLYTNPRDRAAVEAQFKARYGSRWREVYGATVGRVRREQAASGRRSHTERIKSHRAKRGKTVYRVRGHTARIR